MRLVATWWAVVAATALLLGALPSSAGAFNLTAAQPADRVLGQPDFTTLSAGPDTDIGMRLPSDVAQDGGGRIWVADKFNNRVVRYAATPGADGAAFDLVLGQSSTTSLANAFWGCGNTRLYHPSAVWVSGTMLFVADEGNNRVLVWTTLPTTNGEPADIVLGQPDSVTCTAGSTAAKMNGPSAVWSDGTRVLVADTNNNRVLAWTAMPGTHGVAANFALGQTSLTATADDDGAPTASTLDRPQDVWSNGTRVLVADTQNNRILAWNAFPAANAAPATWAIGQANLTTETWWVCGDDMLGRPTSVASNGTRITAVSAIEDRGLAWTAWPTAHQPIAAWSFGQPDLVACDTNRNLTLPTTATLRAPGGVWTNGTTTWIADTENNRVLQYAAWPTANGPAATRILGQTTGARAAANAAALTNTFLFRPFPNIYGDGLSITQNPVTGGVFVADNAHNRVSYFATEPASDDAAPTWIMGQPSSSSSYCNGANGVVSATTVCWPRGMWTDGTRFVLADQANNRVLVWNTMPSAANDPPDLVLGQAAFTTSGSGTTASTMHEPFAVASDGRRLYVADFWNNRVLGWSSWPTSSGQAADFVLGQSSFTTSTANSGGVSGATMNGPTDIDIDETGRLVVADQYNHRILLWRTAPSSSSVPADIAIGQANLTSNVNTGDADYVKGVTIREGSIAWTNGCGARYLAAVPEAHTASGTVIGNDCVLASTAANTAYPSDIHLSSRGELWLGDDGHARVLRFSDSTAPVISSIGSTTVDDQAAIRYATDEAATTEVYWGSSTQAVYTGYPNSRVVSGAASTAHGTHLYGLAQGTYYYRVRSVDGNGNASVSTERTFTVAYTRPVPGNTWTPNGYVGAIERSGSSLFLGGYFSQVGRRSSQALIVSDTGAQLDHGPRPVAHTTNTNEVYDVIPDGTGGWYVGGPFTDSDGQDVGSVIRLRPDGARDTTFVAPFEDWVSRLHLAHGRLYVATSTNGNQVRALDPVTGALDGTFAAVSTSSRINALASTPTRLYLGGNFSTVNGVASTRLASVTTAGVRDAAFVATADSTVNAIAADPVTGRLYVGGYHSTLSGNATVPNLGAVSLTNGSFVAWDPNANDSVFDLELVGDDVLAAGTFTNIGGQVRSRVGIVSGATATAIAGFVPSTINGTVNDAQVDHASGRVYVVGAFTTVNAVAQAHAAALSLATGAHIAAFAPSVMVTPNGAVGRLALGSEGLLLGNGVRGVNPVNRSNLAEVDAVTGAPLAWTPAINNNVRSLLVHGGKLYVGGGFTNVDATARNRLVAFDLGTKVLDPGFVPSITGGTLGVKSLATDGTSIFVGGDFTTVNGAAQLGLTKLSTAGATQAFPAIVGGMFAEVHKVHVTGGEVWVGGDFTSVGGPAQDLARLTTAGAPLPAPSVSGDVYAVAGSGPYVMIGGTFGFVDALPREYLARIERSTGPLLAGPTGAAAEQVVQLVDTPIGLLAAGGFTTIQGAARDGIAMLDPVDDGPGAWAPSIKQYFPGAPSGANAAAGSIAVAVDAVVNALPDTRLAIFTGAQATTTRPTITDNQGNLSWRNTAPPALDVDLADTAGLSKYYVKVTSGPHATGTVHQGWTEVTSPALSGTSFTTNWSLPASTWTAMAQGTNYVSVRVTSTSGGQHSLADVLTVQKDTAAPVAPTISASSPTATSPAIGWTTPVEAATASSSGDSFFRVERGTSSTGPWTLVSTDGSVTTGAFVDSGAAIGTHWYRVRSVDVPGNLGTWSNVISVVYDNPPTAALVTPAAAATVSTTPTLTATYADPDGGSGTVEFEVCSVSDCSTVVRVGASGSTASGANGSWAVSPALATATQYWWRARGDDGVLDGSWSGIRTFTTAAAAPTVTSATANTAPQGREGIVVQVGGTGFVNGASVAFSGTGVAVTNTSWVSATRIDVTLDVAGSATLGARNVTVTNPDTASGSGSNLFTVTAPAITVSLSTLGHGDAARDTVAPYAFSWGTVLPGTPREIGPAGSGQVLAGPAVEVNVQSDTTWQLTASATDYASGGNTIAASQMAWKHYGVTEAWTAFATTAQLVETAQAPANVTKQYDARITIPAAQAAGTYTSTMTWSVVAQP